MAIAFDLAWLTGIRKNNYLSRKFELVALSSSEKFIVEIPTHFHKWGLKNILVIDFCSNDFPCFFLAKYQ